jgi:uncharacterized protein YjiS (DUF1127 family)
MRFESQWPGDAIAAPVYPTYDCEDAIFEDLGGKSWSRVDGYSDQTDVEPPVVVPERLLPPGGRRHRRDPGMDRLDRCHAESAPADFAGWRARIVSIVAGLWSRMLCEREIRRLTAAWQAVDDRTLKDIGISRYEITYARDARRWR